MSEAERRHTFHSRRVLIETARVLSPQFDDSLVCLSGAHLELLRNLTQYLDRHDTFVSEYADGYYLSPDDEDWDDISWIVADLEERLMGCTEIAEAISDLVAAVQDLRGIEQATPILTYKGWGAAGGWEYWSFAGPPEGYAQHIWRLTGTNASRVGTYVHVSVHDGTDYRVLEYVGPGTQGAYAGLREQIRIKYPMYARIGFFGQTVGDALKAVLVATNYSTVPS